MSLASRYVLFVLQSGQSTPKEREKVINEMLGYVGLDGVKFQYEPGSRPNTVRGAILCKTEEESELAFNFITELKTNWKTGKIESEIAKVETKMEAMRHRMTPSLMQKIGRWFASRKAA